MKQHKQFTTNLAQLSEDWSWDKAMNMVKLEIKQRNHQEIHNCLPLLSIAQKQTTAVKLQKVRA